MLEILRCILTGKERIFLEVGKVLQKYVYVGAAKATARLHGPG
jgi:hypothetical protein